MADERLLAGLRAVAARLDDDAPPLVADRLPSGSMGPDRRPVVALAAAVFVAAVGVATWLLVDRGSDDDSVVTPGPVEAPLEGGFAIAGGGDEVTLYGFDGTEQGHARLDGSYFGPALVVGPEGFARVPPPDRAEVPEGCTAPSSGGGVTVALCGALDDGYQRIDVVRSDGTTTPLIGSLSPPESPIVLGQWRWALVSPDGRWVLAQWSAECEVLHGFVLSTDGSVQPRAVVGQLGADGDFGPASTVLGWAPDGRAVVEIQNTGCSAETDGAGVALLDPATGERELVRAASDDQGPVYSWTATDEPMPEAERALRQALDELGIAAESWLPQRDPDVTVMIGAPGEQLQIFGGPSGQMAVNLPGELRPVPLLSGEAAVPVANEYALAFTCGGTTWIISQYNWEPGAVDRKLPFAEELVPHLACTLGPPPG